MDIQEIENNINELEKTASTAEQKREVAVLKQQFFEAKEIKEKVDQLDAEEIKQREQYIKSLEDIARGKGAPIKEKKQKNYRTEVYCHVHMPRPLQYVIPGNRARLRGKGPLDRDARLQKNRHQEKHRIRVEKTFGRAAQKAQVRKLKCRP